MKNSIGDNMIADWMEVSTKEDDDEMKGHGFSGSLVSFEDEVPRDKKKPGATTPDVKTPDTKPKNPPPP